MKFLFNETLNVKSVVLVYMKYDQLHLIHFITTLAHNDMILRCNITELQNIENEFFELYVAVRVEKKSLLKRNVFSKFLVRCRSNRMLYYM